MADSQHKHPDYKKIYITLVILLVISVAGPHLGIEWVTLITAFGIAVVKADLVVRNFMHLKWERRIMKWMLTSSLVVVGLFFAGVAPDVMEDRGLHWVNNAALAATERGIEAPHHGAEAQPAEGHGEAGAAAAASEHGAATGNAPAGGAAASTAAAAPAAQEFDAKAAFESVCATCHGKTGNGDGPGAAALNPKPADFADPAFWKGKTDAELLKAIREGGASVGRSPLMPAWGSLYNEAQAKALLAYIKTLKKG